MKIKLLPHQRRKADGGTRAAAAERTAMLKGWRFYQAPLKRTVGFSRIR